MHDKIMEVGITGYASSFCKPTDELIEVAFQLDGRQDSMINNNDTLL